MCVRGHASGASSRGLGCDSIQCPPYLLLSMEHVGTLFVERYFLFPPVRCMNISLCVQWRQRVYVSPPHAYAHRFMSQPFHHHAAANAAATARTAQEGMSAPLAAHRPRHAHTHTHTHTHPQSMCSHRHTGTACMRTCTRMHDITHTHTHTHTL